MVMGITCSVAFLCLMIRWNERGFRDISRNPADRS